MSHWGSWNRQSRPRVQAWLAECREQHPWCGDSVVQNVPTRLVYISDKSTYRLIETKEMKKGWNEKYVALSYVWGEKRNGISIHQVKLKNDSLKTLKNGIDPIKITTSHHQGIMVAFELGFRYIWIDALCILQDSQEDWKNAATEVPHIYGNAALTIIAGNSNDSREGFLQNRQPLRLPYSCSGSNGTMPTLEVSLPADRAVGPTDNRAWCFQESLLSKRSLIFGTGQLIFRCRKQKKFQDGKHDNFMFDEAAFEHNWVLPVPPNVPRTANDEWQRTQSDIAKGWYRIAQLYSARDMYDPYDCYAALAGIAKRCESALAAMSVNKQAPRYLAGLWETETFVHALMWRRCLDASLPQDCQLLRQPVREGSPIKRAPSWSWMALVGRITFHCAPMTAGAPISTFTRIPCCIPAIGNRTTWTSKNWGIATQLTADEIAKSLPLSIEVKGRPHQVRATKGKVRNFMLSLKHGETYPAQPTISDAEHPNLQAHGVVLQDLHNPDEEKGIALALFDQKRPKDAELWALPILTLSIGHENVPSEGLLLSRNNRGGFYRVGVFWVRTCEVFMGAEECVLSIE